MNFFELLFIAVGLSMDAFAVSVTIGITIKQTTLKKLLIVGLYFGFFQAIMPLVGYLVGKQFTNYIIAYDHWIAFVLLLLIGIKMIIESCEKKGCPDRKCPDSVCSDRQCPNRRLAAKRSSLGFRRMFPLAIATSIDALAVGVSFAFLKVSITPAVLFIGITTLLLSMLGVKIGNNFGTRLKLAAELTGGIILILIGTKILLEHTGVISF